MKFEKSIVLMAHSPAIAAYQKDRVTRPRNSGSEGLLEATVCLTTDEGVNGLFKIYEGHFTNEWLFREVNNSDY